MSGNGTATPSPSVAPSSEQPSTPSATPSPSPSPSDTEPSSAAQPSSDPPSSQVSIPPSSATPEPSSAPPASSAPKPSSNPPATSVVTAPSQAPSTQVITSYVTPSATVPGETPTPSLIVVTSVVTPSNAPEATNGTPSGSAAPTDTAGATLADPSGSNKDGGGLDTGGKTAIAVTVPVVVVALLVIAGILFWRKRKQRKSAEEARRKEVEEYGFNPNNDPTLPAVGMQSEMAEDQSGYRGWGNTTTSSNRKGSTTLNSGMTHSDSNSNPGGYQSPGSPTQGSVDPLMAGRRETMDSEGIGALGAAPSANQNQAGVHRGPSNASSSYSAANHSDNSGDYPMPMNNQQEYYDNGYYQPNPYGNDGYGGGQQPIIRDVSARRNTRIENPSIFPQQGNSGIAQNF